MPVEKIARKIRGDGPGKTTDLWMFRFRPEGAAQELPKIYIQASLHANEQPGMMVAHHLIDLLTHADAGDELAAEFVIVPMANPVGMGQIQHGQHLGRYDMVNGINFNRRWPNLFSKVKDKLDDALTEDMSEVQIRATVRGLVKDWLDQLQPVSAREQQQAWTMGEAYNADYVFDLHCDDISLTHLFAVPQMYPEYQDLSDWLGISATLLAEDGGGASFDEVWPSLWIELQKHYPEREMPKTVCACTIEYRGVADVDDALNREDAERMMAFFRGRGLLRGENQTQPTPAKKPTPLEATAVPRVEHAGLLAYKVKIGDQVKTGDVIAELVVIEGEEAFEQRLLITSETDGLVLSMHTNKYVWPGCSVAKIVGETPLESRGEYLLED